ncbi:MAG TPA: ATP-binding protein [Myxococcaceae bacterium]
MTGTPVVNAPEQLQQRLVKLRNGGALAITAVLAMQHRHDWRVLAVLAGMTALLLCLNLVIVPAVRRRYSQGIAETLRMFASAVCFLVYGPLVGWSLVLWLYLPLNMVWLHGSGGRERTRAALYLLITALVPLLDGCDPMLPLAFGMLGVFCFLIAEQRTAILLATLRQVVEQQQQLQQVHQRALAQEKLSSLGMMAAGVAHEINNPMSFVTSNVSSLYKDLKRQPGLPESLKEYVDDVLPATLDGIKRVNDIVSDLRRFSRGDSESYSEYRLDDEIHSALRLAHSALVHCQVALELEEVGPMVGRPRQIGQVMMNLLVNAGQATAPGGQVVLSTQREGEGVVVKVRDTGVGMSPETMSHLFQPFFTTKPQGAGTGLGLAVVHGIVTSHGGRIEVESEPGQGTCFTLHLPRVPPVQQPGPARRASASGSTPSVA